MNANLLAKKLLPWYREVKRPLPWRVNRDPYRIWVSEVMLQQTTVTAVIPYFEKFIQKFPGVNALANAREDEVMEYWAGLGYYSRARSLHASAKKISSLGDFPKSHVELLELPGFGPYTARSVASLAFGERVGVVDGNVIRVLCRVLDLDLEWWKTKDRNYLQSAADRLAQAIDEEGVSVDPSDINQGLMELGATVCTVQSPTCLLCPWLKNCRARKNDTILQRPRSKPRRESEIWAWQPEIYLRRDRKILLIENNYAPFLRGHLIWPGKAVRLKKKPKHFHYKGGVTHHEIYVTVTRAPVKSTERPDQLAALTKDLKPQWVSQSEMKTKVPSSLIRKAIEVLDLDENAST